MRKALALANPTCFQVSKCSKLSNFVRSVPEFANSCPAPATTAVARTFSMQQSVLVERAKVCCRSSASKAGVVMTRPPSFGRRSISKGKVKEFTQGWLPTLLQEQEQVQQLTEHADLLAWRAEMKQQKFINKLSAAVDVVNMPIQLTKMQQQILGMDVMQGPVLDLSLLDSTMCAAGPSTATPSSRKSRRFLQDKDVSADDAALSALAVSIQETNSLLVETNDIYDGAVARINGLLATSTKLDKQAEAALNELLAIESDDEDSTAASISAMFQEHVQQYSMQQCQQEQLYAVYGSQQQTEQQQHSNQQPVQLLKTPEQQIQLDSAVQQGLLVVPLHASVGQLGAGGAVSAEQLAWMMQEGHLPDSPAGNLLAEDTTNNNTELIKVEVKVSIKTKPGQDVVLVGSHPSLGSWSMDDALALKWSDGHVWRGTIELPADCSSFEYKAVLRCPDGPCWEAGGNRRAQLEGCDCITLQHAFRCS